MTYAGIFSPFRTVLLFAVVATTGVFALSGLQVNLLPVQKKSSLEVSFSIPNSSPAVTEQQATAILEGACSQLMHLKKISSVSEYDNGRILLEFDKSTDMQFRQFELASLIRRVYDQLPPGVSYPLISGGSNSGRNNSPFLVYNINAPQQSFAIKEQAEQFFGKALSELSGISSVTVTGAGDLQLTIQYNLEKCLAWGLTPATINASLKAWSGISFPGSLITGSGERFVVRIPSRIHNIQDIENILLVAPSRQQILLKDIASVYIEEKDALSYFRINGESSVSIGICAHAGENNMALAKQVKAAVKQAADQLPEGYNISIAYDDAKSLEEEMLQNYFRTGFSFGILILFILLSYRNWRYLLLLLSGFVMNLSLTLLMVYIFSVPFHLYTIAGIAIASGIMTDNAIVMIDYYKQWRNRNVFLALLASTLTTLSALSLVFFLPEEARNNLGDFSLIIILSLISSMLVALFFIPALFELLISENRDRLISNATVKKRRSLLRISRKYCWLISTIGRFRKTFITGVILLFGLPLFMLPKEWKGDHWYHRLYNKSFGSEYYQETVKPVSDKWLGGSLRMFVNDVFENSGYRSPEQTKLYLSAELPFGNTLDQMNSIMMDYERYLSKIEGIDKFITSVYSGRKSRIEISFKKEYEYSDLPFRLKSQLISRAMEWAGVDFSVSGVGKGFSNASADELPGYMVAMKGYNYDELEKQAGRLALKLSENNRVQKININEKISYGRKQSNEFVLSSDLAAMSLAGTNTSEISQQLISQGKQTRAMASITMNNRYYPIVFKTRESERFSVYDLLNHPLVLDSNRQVRLKDFSQMTLQTTASSIQREDRQYIRMVSFQYLGSWQLGNEYLKEVLAEMRQEMPVGYSAAQKSGYLDWEKTRSPYLLLFILILINFLICSILFESLRQPFYIITMVPVSFIGLFLTFSLGGFYFDQGGYAAFVMLGGLVVNAAIFIINDLNNLRKRFPQRSFNKNLIRAILNRSRTVMLTTISACCGLIPFLMEGPDVVFWFPLAVGAIGGLLFSLFAVFVVLPVLLWKK